MTSAPPQSEFPQSTSRPNPIERGLGPRGIVILAFVMTLSFPLMPRFATVTLFGVALAIILIVATLTLKQNRTLWPEMGAILPDPDLRAPIIALVAWSALACLWSADPGGGAIKVLLLFGLVLTCFTLSQALSSISTKTGEALLTGFIAAMTVAALYIAFESITGRSLHEFLVKSIPIWLESYDKHLKIGRSGEIAISDANLNRSTLIFGVLFIPAATVALHFRQHKLGAIALAIFTVCAVLTFLYTRHRSSQLALLVGLAAFIIAYYRPSWARLTLMAGWIGAFVLVIPLMLTAHKLDLHHAKWLGSSERARLIIWNYTAERTIERWYSGVGTNATRTLDRMRKKEIRQKKEIRKKRGQPAVAQTRAHPHNFFIHVWYELGIVGVILVGWLGVALLRWTTTLGRWEPVMLTQLAVTAAMMAASYGMWQTWFQVGLASGVLATYAGSRLVRTE